MIASVEGEVKGRTGSGEETTDRTDGDSTYSSFYSSLLKTTSSGSTEDNSDAKYKQKLGIKRVKVN